jgi:hypothetical protein
MLTLEYDTDGGTVKNDCINKKSPDGRDRQPILQDPFGGIQVFSKKPSDEEGTCYSSYDDEDLDEGMGERAYGASYLSWIHNAVLSDG